MTDCGALAEAIGFLNHCNDPEDPRQRGKVLYPLDKVPLPALVAKLTGAGSGHRHRRQDPAAELSDDSLATLLGG